MKKLNVTKEQFEKSNYFTKKYGKLEYVSESGKLFKTNKGKVLMFKEAKESTKKFGKKFVKESCDEDFDRYYERMKKIFRYDSGIHIRLRDNEDGSETIEVTFDDRFNWNDDVVSGRIPLDEDSGLLDWITRFDEQAHRNGWEFDFDIAKDIESPIDGGANNDYLAMLTLTCKCDKEEVEDDKLFESSVGEGETGTMAKVNDLVSKAYASLYDELKKAGIDFDSASDDGFYVNDPDAQKTYFINLYVNECGEYEGSYK